MYFDLTTVIFITFLYYRLKRRKNLVRSPALTSMVFQPVALAEGAPPAGEVLLAVVSLSTGRPSANQGALSVPHPRGVEASALMKTSSSPRCKLLVRSEHHFHLLACYKWIFGTTF